MLESIDLSRNVPKGEFKAECDALVRRLGALQRLLVERRVPVLVVFEGWDAAGKGTLINEMEQHMVSHGIVLLKFWLHIDPAEQLRRFHERETVPHKRWKITDEDWRNRRKWWLIGATVFPSFRGLPLDATALILLRPSWCSVPSDTARFSPTPGRSAAVPF
jgi:polyphosphate kinase 2 (PPK2 family)